MIRITSGTVEMTETTLKQIVAAVEKARKETNFTTEPIPRGDMAQKQYLQERRRRGFVTVATPYDGIRFEIDLGLGNQSESLGYELV